MKITTFLILCCLCSSVDCIEHDMLESMIQSVWLWLISHLSIVLNILIINMKNWSKNATCYHLCSMFAHLTICYHLCWYNINRYNQLMRLPTLDINKDIGKFMKCTCHWYYQLFIHLIAKVDELQWQTNVYSNHPSFMCLNKRFITGKMTQVYISWGWWINFFNWHPFRSVNFHNTCISSNKLLKTLQYHWKPFMSTTLANLSTLFCSHWTQYIQCIFINTSVHPKYYLQHFASSHLSHHSNQCYHPN